MKVIEIYFEAHKNCQNCEFDTVQYSFKKKLIDFFQMIFSMVFDSLSK